MVLNLWTTVWGPKAQAYVDLMLPSLLQPGNIPAIFRDIYWYTFYTNDEARKILLNSPLFETLQSLVSIRFEHLQKGEWEVTSNTTHQMRTSLEEDKYMMVCSPEDVIGDYSLKHLVDMIKEGHNPILYHLPRTRDSSYKKMAKRMSTATHKPISNRELVSFTLDNLYLKVSRYPKFPLPDGTVRVYHPTPTPIIKPDKDILAIWETNWGANWGYDNCLPYIMIERGYPWYLVPDSDMYFHIEVGGWVNFGPSGKPMNSPCCTWQMDKSHAICRFFRTDGMGQKGPYDQSKLYTIWRPK